MKRIKKILIVSFICALALIGTAGLTFSQIPPQAVPPADTGEVQPQPEAPKQILNVKVENDLLSVELLDADFGTVINSIAEKSGFKVEMTADVAARKITTKFNEVEIERGVLRLLTLIKEKNYMSHYNTKGMLSKLEIYGSGPATTTKPSRPAAVRPPVQRPVVTTPAPVVTSPSPAAAPPRPPVPFVRPVPARPRFPQTTPRPQQQQVTKPQTPEAPAQPDDEEDENVRDEDDESDVSATEIPYIAPQKKPVFIPPAKK